MRERESYGGGGRDRSGKMEIVICLQPAVVAALTKIADALAASKSEITPEMIAAARKVASETQEKLKASLEKGTPPPPT